MDRLLVLNFLLLFSIGVAFGKPINAELPPFTQVIVCIPLAVSVRPTSSKDRFEYSIYIKAEPHVVEAIQYEVTDGVLSLTLDGDLVVNDPVQIVAILPADKLEAVENHGIAVLLVESGFTSKSMTFSGSTGNIRADDVSVDRVLVKTFGGSTVVIDGTIQEAEIKANGFSEVVTKGVQTSAKATIDGRSRVYITGSPEKTITGSVHFFGSVFVDESASCSLSTFFFSAECKSITVAEVPTVEHKWTSHMSFSGDASCKAEKGYHVATKTVTTEPGAGQKTFSSVTTVSPGGHAKVSTHAGTSVVGTTTAASAEAHAAGKHGGFSAASASTAVSTHHEGGSSISPFPYTRRLMPKPVFVT